jgi:hypothetical protein
MSFDVTNPFHVAQVVTDLEASMEELTNGLGVTWHSIQERVMHIRYGGEVVRAELRFTYSVEGDPQIELLEGSAGSVWGPDFAGMHHIGVWTDDFLADVAALEASGVPVEVTLASRTTDGPHAFTYHNLHGLRVELVPVEMKAAFDSWFAGGDFA